MIAEKFERMIGKNELPLSAANIKKNGSAEPTGYAFRIVTIFGKTVPFKFSVIPTKKTYCRQGLSTGLSNV